MKKFILIALSMLFCSAPGYAGGKAEREAAAAARLRERKAAALRGNAELQATADARLRERKAAALRGNAELQATADARVKAKEAEIIAKEAEIIAVQEEIIAGQKEIAEAIRLKEAAFRRLVEAEEEEELRRFSSAHFPKPDGDGNFSAY